MTPTISVNVNLRNPGQVFACCGLFELAHRLSGTEQPAMAWFESIDTVVAKFHVGAYGMYDNGKVTLETVVQHLRCAAIEDGVNKMGPLRLGDPFHMAIDWREPYPQHSSVKAWSLTSTSTLEGLVNRMVEGFPEKLSMDLLSEPTACSQKATRFDISHSGNKIDIGYSYDVLKDAGMMKSFSLCVATELLALVGLQRFAPKKYRQEQLTYRVWDRPLPVEVAAIAIDEKLPSIGHVSYRFHMENVGTRDNPSYAFSIAKRQTEED